VTQEAGSPLGPVTPGSGSDRADASEGFISLDRVYKIHGSGENGVAAVGGVTLQVARGGFAALVGPSGAGKSTILNLIGGVERSTAGVVSVGGINLAQLDSSELVEYRRRMVGFVWQGAAKNLVPYLTAAQNVELPLLLAGRKSATDRQRRITELLELFGIATRANHLPVMLSGGEQQRVALAVALANAPSVLLADEPTAEIDTEAAHGVVGALRGSCDELGATVVMATHDLVVAAVADTIFRLLDGRIRLPAGRARLDEEGRVRLPALARELLGRDESEVELDIDGAEVRMRVVHHADTSVPDDLAKRAAPALTPSRASEPGPRPTLANAVRDDRGHADPTLLLMAEHVRRSYGQGATETQAVRDVSLGLAAGEFVVITGPSGSGKSTLLGLLGGFEPPDAGRVFWDGQDISELPSARLAHLRAMWLGVVFQALGLLPTLTAHENIALPLLVSGWTARSANQTAENWLRRLGLAERIEHRVNELSLGQQQRVAVARALAPEPAIVLADEPTTEMDHEAAQIVLGALEEVTLRQGGVILASHEQPQLHRSTHVIVLRDGSPTDEPSPAVPGPSPWGA
jgi:ABC-type lipoprotein export system ATPase subunit